MTRGIDPRSHLPLHAQVERLVRELCDRPEHRGGALLPDEIGLARKLGVSRNTVRAAIERLVQEGLLERRRGVGTRVCSARAVVHSAEWDAFLAELEPRGEGVVVRAAETLHEPADADVARALLIEVGTETLRLQRVLGDAEGPLARIRSWFHPRLAFPADIDFRRPLWELIERDLALVPTVAHEEIASAIVDAETACLLALRRGSAVLVRRRVVADAQGRPLELAVGCYSGERARRQIEIRRDHRR